MDTLFDLQRSAGNQAVARLFGMPALGAAPPALELEDRLRLEAHTGDRFDKAYVKFCDAANDKRDELRAAARADAAMIGFLAGLLVGPLAPFAGKALASLLDKVPVKSPDIVYAIASKGIEHSTALANTAMAVGKREAGQALGALMRAEDEEAFLEQLKQGFSVVLDEMQTAFKDTTDVEMLAIWANYDPDVATKALYLDEIDRKLDAFQAAQEEAERRRREREQAEWDSRTRIPFGGKSHKTSSGSRVYE